ncbi:MAG: M23 family metallopeptidase [Tannerella sp.]|nr:M23 family metallopeptidase [Tannerella sp.]
MVGLYAVLCKRCFVFRHILIPCEILAVFLWAMSCKPDKPAPEEDNGIPEIADTSAYLYDIRIDSLDVTPYTIRSGDNLSLILARLHLSSVSDSIIRAAKPVLDPKKLRQGASFTTFATQDSIKKIQYLVFAKSRTDYVVIDLSGPSIEARAYRKDVIQRQCYIEGAVNTSLWKEMKKQGIDPMLAVLLSDIFAWQIDFFALQPNDSFQAIYTESFMDDSVSLGITSVDGAIFTQAGHAFMAVPFTQDSIPEYFDADGQSLRRAFLKAPLDFFRISSHFSNSRFHPVLKRYRAHHGVDYAAPSGTPVKTIGNGKVIDMGFQANGGGNYAKIQHNSTYTTSYMHLRGFAKGLAKGKTVRQGEVIGYVGSTGLSTGPHLDFRVYKNGSPINPLKMESPPAYPVKPELKDSFNSVKQQMTTKFNDLKLQHSNISDSTNIIISNL